MKLVETDTAVPADEVALEEDGKPTPPRPEHRRVSVSLLFTLFVLVATVVTVYLVVPERHNALMEAAIEAHESTAAFELERPTRAEVRAWSLALLEREVPWPDARDGVEILGVRSARVLNRRAALVRYRVDGAVVTVLVQRPRDAVPQAHWREHGDTMCISWRRGKFTFTAVGPAAEQGWREFFGTP